MTARNFQKLVLYHHLGRWIGLSVLFLLLAGGIASAQNPLDTKKKKIEQLQFEREQITKQLADFRESETDLLKDIRQLSSQLRSIKAREQELTRNKAQQLKQREEQKKEITRLQTEMKKLQEQAARHIARIYRFTKLGDSATLLTLSRHKEFFKDTFFLAKVARSDVQVVRKYSDIHQKLRVKQEDILKTLDNLNRLERQLSAEKRELKGKTSELQRDLNKLRKNRRLYGQYLKEVEEVKKGMEAAVVSMERRASAPKIRQVKNPNDVKGKLPPPAKGEVLAGFGDQDPRYELKKFQRGLVLKVTPETKVTAVAPGNVVHAGPFRGYQQLVVLDHGKGLFSVYGHLEKLRVTKGEALRQGALLGTSAYQPAEEAYNVYFEIRYKGNPEDPMQWLRKNAFQ